ncbi:MAG: M23 family metallopeptidase, partial [Chloroflexia bacterium]
MRIFSSLLCILVILSLMPGLGWTRPSGDASAEEPQQALQLAYPLVRRWKLTSLFDHTDPNAVFRRDGQIQIYTGAMVSDNPADPNDHACDQVGGNWVCGYTDYDTSLWNLRWDQDYAGGGGGPGWLWYDSHNGYDMPCPDNTPVNATRQGTAYLEGTHSIRINHSSNFRTYYRHLNGRDVGNGQSVVLGQRIGLSGHQGTSSGPHLHFEMQYLSGGVWTYVDPSGWEQGNLWAGGEPFPLGYVDQNNIPHGPFQLDNTKIRDKWLSVARCLGSPVEDDFSYGCLAEGTQATGYMQGFERGYIAYCGGGSAQVTYYNQTFLPRILASEDANAWNSTVSIRNLNAAGQATVSLTFFTRDGRVLDSRVYPGLPANATWEVGVRGILYDQFL